jgi:hypothetical protein
MSSGFANRRKPRKIAGTDEDNEDEGKHLIKHSNSGACADRKY